MIVTKGLVGANVIVFVAMLLAGVQMLSNPSGEDLVRFGANFGPLTLSGEWWRLLSCVFIHGGLLHIAFNMWCLWDLGNLAESIYGRAMYLAVYVISGVASSLASIFWNPLTLSVGASGAIFGVAGALIASFYLGEFSLPRAAMNGMLRSVMLFVGYNLFFGAVVARTDNAAHVGGLIMGLLFGALIAKFAPRADAVGLRLAIVLVGLLLVFCAAIYLRKSAATAFHHQLSAVIASRNPQS